MSDDSVYNIVELVRLVADALRPLVGTKIDRLSFNININETNSDENDEFYIVMNKKKWRIKIEEGDNNAISI